MFILPPVLECHTTRFSDECALLDARKSMHVWAQLPHFSRNAVHVQHCRPGPLSPGAENLNKWEKI